MLKKISKYRNALMGIAILWIMLHHSGLNMPMPFFTIKRLGYCGVEMFLFLSGLGCAYSLSKNNDRFQFYSRRLKRIYPHYLPMLIPFFIITTYNTEAKPTALEWTRDILGNITGISYWTLEGNRFNWYISGIIAFYLITPLLYEAMTRYNKKGLWSLLVIAFIIGFCFARNTLLRTAISRLPIYILGVYAGILLVNNQDNEEKNTGLKTRIIAYLGGVIGLLIILLLYKYQTIIPVDFYNVFYPCILISFAICCFFCQVFEMLDNSHFGQKIIKVASFLGSISLDLYLIHIVAFSRIGIFLEGSYDKENPRAFDLKNSIVWFLVTIGTVIVAIIYNKLVTLITDSIEKKQIIRREEVK